MDEVKRDEAAMATYVGAERDLLDAHHVRGEVRDLQTAGGPVHMIDTGGDGPPVVLVSGGGATGATWGPLLAHLHGYRAIAVDRPGFGLTPPADLGTTPLGDVAVRFLDDVLDALQLRSAVLLGNSMGSWWITRYALARPDRVHGMVHVGCPALLLTTSAPLPMRVMGVRGLGRLLLAMQRPSPKNARMQLRMSGDPLGETAADRAMVEVLVAMQRLPYCRSAWLDLLHATVGPRGARRGMSITPDDLRTIRTPTLFVWGERDAFGAPAVGGRAVQLMPTATIATVPYGHAPWVSDAAAVATPIRGWLAARASPSVVADG
ncbi:alpha/beta fold hydrolase [Actinotalea sp. Marseille-Q4924]|uniref:alpha/beta fold hydrolase n=1 Tax=Actinotalea sp. Marseille-Q4924 TaxID=2866571 RepID=UPI001CE45BD6|nr:alpha/beta hydrolase [Actinotalea sp. Marseille-Q4924]